MKTNIRNWLRPVELGSVSAEPKHGEMKRLTRGSLESGVYDWYWGMHKHDPLWDNGPWKQS